MPRRCSRSRKTYNGKDYHQPSDEYDPSWDFSGGVDDMRVLAQLGWRVAAQPDMPRYNDGDQFAQVASKRNVATMHMEPFVTLDEIRAARERIKNAARVTPLIECVAMPGTGAAEHPGLLV